MATLSLMDLGFVVLERDTNPTHICGLVVLTPPAGKEEGFAQHVVSRFQAEVPDQAPFNQVLSFGLTHLPRWQTTTNIDMEYHVRQSRLPAPGDRHQLLELVGRIHSYRLDRSRPLWELWVIDGLENNQVALVIKMHHAMADGVKSVSMFNYCCSETPEDTGKMLWQLPQSESDKLERSRQQVITAMLKRQFKANIGLAKLGTRLAMNWANLATTRLNIPFTAPRTPFNISRDKARTIALTKVPMHRLHRLAKLTGTTVNDIILTVTDMALHRYLAQHNWASDKPMVAQMPINLRREGEEFHGCNKFTLGMIELGRSDDLPLVRLHSIRDATVGAKQEALDISPDAYYQYATLINGIGVLAGRLDLDHWVPPTTNMLISNVPGPKTKQYFMGAEVSEFYPVSLLMPGQTLNVTLLSYGEDLNFSFVCCRRSLPGFDAMTGYLQESVTELEQETLRAVAEVLYQPTG
ncbi:wax ester/triacylglycerol synthase family O-acyltransferase [Ferrimonas lipolytica]|uniref:diacylglycerol O-acyltransferase n=1 Tax=Ferrimonas lipolytica TaxID=2724191 RepID=A0A6H1UB08_9GAMM|nr:wax ester/triacylglycerol synthase family O-acyltransferase [Ferrimonas lipolytica]QIZ75543.1 wax ester/triacylglycerol synthase family O-acyltransferase [Ferrimonas lipolytica]